jgi:hypothetical protein
MKKLFCLWFILFLGIQAQTQYRFNINNINLPFNNKGTIANVNIPPDGAGGRFGVSTFLFDAGFMLSGYNSDTLWACGQAAAQLLVNFLPGNVDSLITNPIYKIYVNDYSTTPNYSDWQDYTNAVRTGASFYDGNDDGIYDPTDLNGNDQWDPNEDKPDLIGDKTAWCVFNDGVPEDQRAAFSGIGPLGIEVRQSIFGYQSLNELQNVLFIRYELINTGKVSSVLDSVYFTSYADPDLGIEFDDDMVGSDIDRKSKFGYNADNSDPGYGSSIPSFFIRLLEGPQTYIPGETFIDNNSNGIYDESIDTSLDSAIVMQGKDNGVKYIPGAKNLSLTSATHFLFNPDRQTATNEFEMRNFMLGNLKTGAIFDPCNPDNWGGIFGGADCSEIDPRFWYSGDPVNNYGWLMFYGTDQKMFVNTGPFNLEVGKPVSIILAYIVGQGVDRLESITKAREIAEYTHNFYLSNFGEFPVGVDENAITQLPNDFSLFQNYPNPFNPSTKISWQSPVGSYQTLKIFDVLGNEVATLVNEYRNAGNYEIEFNPASSIKNPASGVYFYQLKAGEYLETKKMLLIK